MIERRKMKAANDRRATYTFVLPSRSRFVAFISDKKGRQPDRLGPCQAVPTRIEMMFPTPNDWKVR